MEQAKYLEVEAGVRYWEDARIDGREDSNGELIPCRKGDAWCPVIRLEDGWVLGWPEGKEADIHYKVCDAGLYWLLDVDKNRIAKWSGYYVPDALLCVGDNGYGDYIILKVGGDGKVKNWHAPALDESEWTLTPNDIAQGREHSERPTGAEG